MDRVGMYPNLQIAKSQKSNGRYRLALQSERVSWTRSEGGRRVVDVHIHPFTSASEDVLLNAMDSAGVDTGVLLAIDVHSDDLEQQAIYDKFASRLDESMGNYGEILRRSLPFRHGGLTPDVLRRYVESAFSRVGISDERVVELVQRHPSRFLGFGSADPSKDFGYVQNRLDYIRSRGLRGVKLLPTLQFFNPSENRNFHYICEYCESKGLIIMYHTGCDPGPFEIPLLAEDANPRYLREVLRRCSPTIILAHMGSYSALQPGIWLDEALELARGNEHVWLDTAAVFDMLHHENIVQKIRSAGVMKRILFGSDYPVIEGCTIAHAKAYIESSPCLTAEEKGSILGDNACRLLGLQPSKTSTI